ncbi:MAG: hypothetical protein ABSA69_00815 [Verrucomicrobiota bacterium]|jgi:hypothetical protein
MLHKNPLMADIDVNHWRNLQNLLLESAKEKRRIILIHENGELLKFVHSERADIVRNVTRIAKPLEDAEKVYRANADKTDFVMVLERRAVDRFFAKVQDTWKADEDLDEYVHRMFATLDEYPEGIVTYPGPARTRLGLQWRLGARYEEVKAAVERFVPANSTVVFGVFKENALWASLVLGFDAEKRISVVTTCDPSELTMTGGAWETVAKELVAWANQKYAPCSLGLSMDLDSARAFLSSRNKLATLRDLAQKRKLVSDPLPKPLAQLLAAG